VAASSGHADSGLAVRGLRPVVDGLAALGHDPAPILAAAGLADADWDDPDAHVPTAAAFTMWQHAVERTGDADVGLHVALAAPLSAFDVSAYVMLASPTVGAGYERLSRYQRLIHSATRILIEPCAGERTAIRHVLPGGLAVPRQSAEFLLAIWLRGGRTAASSDWRPAAVRFAHAAPPSTSELERFFGVEPDFAAGENALVVDAALLATPCVRADPALLAILDRHVADLLQRLPQGASLADRVRSVVAAELRGGAAPTQEIVATRVRRSVRSLQRGLAAEGASLSAILDAVRHELALRHLAERRLSIAEVAFLLGYEELSSFYRAFRRWTGTTPGDFRAQRSTRS